MGSFDILSNDFFYSVLKLQSGKTCMFINNQKQCHIKQNSQNINRNLASIRHLKGNLFFCLDL